MSRSGEGRVFRDGGMIIEKDVPIPRQDGHMMSCNVFRPDTDDPVPPIIAFTPYGKDSDVAVDFKRYWDFVLRDHPEVVQDGSSGKYLTWEVPDPERWIPTGYALVVADAPGTGKSAGFYDVLSPQETRALYDVVEWAGVQPWSNGKVGLLGVSYLAVKQWQVAALQPPHLAAMIPWEGFFDVYRDAYRHGGIFSSAFFRLLWDSQLATNQNGNSASPYRDRFTGERSTGAPIDPLLLPGNHVDVYGVGADHPFDDAFMHERTPVAERITVPFLSAGNWGGLGLHLRGNITAFESAASEQKWLELHTDTHFASMYLPPAVELQMRFFDYFLKGEENGWERTPAVLLAIRDPRGPKRRQEMEWPLARTDWVPCWLDAANMALSAEPPTGEASASFEMLGEDLTFWSAPFEQDTEFTGPVASKLFVSSSTTDLDLFLTLRIFDEEGREVTFVGANDPMAPVSQGWLRVSQRKVDTARSTPYRPYHPHDGEQKLTPGTVYEAEVEIWPTSVVYPAGYRMAVTIGGKDFERPGTPGLMKGSGLFLHTDQDDRPAAEFGGTGTIHTGGACRSYLLLPRIDGASP